MKELGVNNPYIIGHSNFKEAHEFFKKLNQDSQSVAFSTDIQNISYTGYSGILLNLPYKDLKSSITQTWIILKYFLIMGKGQPCCTLVICSNIILILFQVCV